MAGFVRIEEESRNHKGAVNELQNCRPTLRRAELMGVVQRVWAGSTEALRALESSRAVALTVVVQDAITTIERTKGSFKSKALAELRERLEVLLYGAPELPAKPVTSLKQDIDPAKLMAPSPR